MLLEVSLMKFILWISKDIILKVKVVLLDVSVINFILRISIGDQVEGESGVTRSIIDEIHSLDIQRYHMKGESGFTRRIIDQLHSSDIQGY